MQPACSISGNIEASAQDDISVYRLEVQDNGIDMEESFSEHIFEPFSREKTSTFNGIYGIGLGLTIVKGIVNLMGGTISVKTALDEGSTFTVTLPPCVCLYPQNLTVVHCF